MLSRRLPGDFTPNEITRLLGEKRRAGARIIDLTETNPTRVGLSGAGPSELRALADPAGARYEPHPQGMPAARQAVAGHYEGRGIRISPDDLLLTASTSEAYAHLFRLLCDPGDEVLIPRPSYPLFEPLAALESVQVERYRLSYHDRWQLDLESVEGALTPRTRALVLVQPNNPTGSCLSAAEIASVESLCAEREIAIISDEVFGDAPWPPSEGPLPSLLGERSALTFVLGGVSKLCGMPQMKAAWIAAAGPTKLRREALRGLEWIADLFLSVASPVQAALPKLLEARWAFQKSLLARIGANRDALAGLGNRRPEFRVYEGDGGWSAVVATPAVDGDFAAAALRDHDVLVHPGHFYDLDPDVCIVVSLLPEPEAFREGLARLGSMTGR